MIYCCARCFGDRGLEQNIIPSMSAIAGICDYCGASEVSLVEPVQLANFFEMLVSIYEPDPDGKLLVDLLKEDWRLFSSTDFNTSKSKDLLGEVLNDGEIVRHTFSPSVEYEGEALARWEGLRDELMYRNRYFLDEAIDMDRLAELLDYLPAENMPSCWYRARIMHGEDPYPIEEMGAPPRNFAANGRANPTGISYLYLGSTAHTAAAEVRPHTGDRASVAEFQFSRDLRAVDLRFPRSLVSPFLLGDADEIGKLRSDIVFLERLGEELTRPVTPRTSGIEYVPTQYLCEFIKKCGYDGVVYRSSVSSGYNLALFDPTVAQGVGVTLYDVSRVSVDVLPVSAI